MYTVLKGKVQKVIFMSAPSTGKTSMMTSEACYLGSLNEDVVFFIPSTFGAKVSSF